MQYWQRENGRAVTPLKPFRLYVGPVVYDVEAIEHLEDKQGDRMAGTVTHDMEQVQVERH